MVSEICHLEGCQFPMTTNIHRYFRHMGDRAHSAWFSICEVDLPWVFCLDHLDPLFVADLSVDEVFYYSGVNHGVDSA